jgi:CheY-like chemotaxis protein
MTKIMLVEDDNSLREIYEARLAAEGYQIVSAKDGEEALAVASKERPELVISDVMMPKISGFEMLDILRNTEGLKTVKVIMLTALGQSEDKTRADSLGADRYLVKSQVTLEDIVNAAGELLNDAPGAPAATPPATPVVTPPVPEATAPPVPAVSTPTPVVVPVTPPPAEPAQPITVAVPPTEPVVVPAAPAATVAAPTPLVIVPPTEPTTPEPVAAMEAAPTPELATVVPSTTSTPDRVAETPEPVEVAPEPTPAEPASPAAVPSAAPSESSTLAEEEAYMQAQIDQFVKDNPKDSNTSESDQQIAAAGSVISNSGDVVPTPPSTAEPVSTPSSTAPPESPAVPPADNAVEVAPEVPEEPAPESEPVIAHKKVIQPLSGSGDAKPDINALLAIEEAKEAATQAGTSQPVIGEVPKPPVDPGSIAL